MTNSIKTFCYYGLELKTVSIEVQVSRGMPYFGIVGMAGASIKESKDRVRCAISSSGFNFPLNRKIINLAPAELPKYGTHFDLPIAIGILQATHVIQKIPENLIIFGELGLDGAIRKTKASISGILKAIQSGFGYAMIPMENFHETKWIKDIKIIPVESLQVAVQILQAENFELAVEHYMNQVNSNNTLSFESINDQNEQLLITDISGHESAKRALMVAAVGSHHIALSGPPGSGKTVLAKAFTSILPEMTQAEHLESMQIHSIAGLEINPFSRQKPFRNVESSCTVQGLIGGGNNLMPGEVSLAHKGVLFMDEFLEFSKECIESLRQPLENGELHLRRKNISCKFPAHFQLLASMNPCPCGYYGDSLKHCTCTAFEMHKYKNKLSGPIADRIDMFVNVPRINYKELKTEKKDTLVKIQEQIMLAKELQAFRYKMSGFDNVNLNNLSFKMIRQEKLNDECEAIVQKAIDQYDLSSRSIFKLIKISRTIADLAQSQLISPVHIIEALQYKLPLRH